MAGRHFALHTQQGPFVHRTDYDRIADAITYLEKHRAGQPSLSDVAHAVHLSPSHLQRVFTRWAGVSPKRFLQYLTLKDAKARLRDGASVLDAAYDAGLSGGGRLHDLFVTIDAVSPGEFKRRGAGLEVRWGLHPSPFGPAVVATTSRGLCGLEFPDAIPARAAESLQRRWPEATLVHDPAATEPAAARVFAHGPDDAPLRLMLRGTNFQLKVWEALLRIPEGRVVSYADVAAAIGRPGASRAVGNAVGANPIAYLIPCHRVIRESGALGGYRWGLTRKRAMLAREHDSAA
jgi:AraC family transcriptional regulator of adaptative response/methylated-DNA-[protein]-cysteine methyltransferase